MLIPARRQHALAQQRGGRDPRRARCPRVPRASELMNRDIYVLVDELQWTADISSGPRQASSPADLRCLPATGDSTTVGEMATCGKRVSTDSVRSWKHPGRPDEEERDMTANDDPTSTFLPFEIKRVFKAPRERVWSAWSKADQLQHWWGQKVVHSTFGCWSSGPVVSANTL